MRTVSLLALLILTAASAASADTIYSYVGDHFTYVTGAYTTQDRILGSFRVADGFTPRSTQGGPSFTDGLLGWSFTDGHLLFTDANSTAQQFIYGPGPTGLNWYVSLLTPEQDSLIVYYIADRFDSVETRFGTGWLGQTVGPPDGSHPGTWTITVPEPATGLLVLLGAAGWLAWGP